MAALITAHREAHRIPHAVACRALGVSRSWFYKWKGGMLPPRAARRERLKAEVARLFKLHEGKYGSPRITAGLRDARWRGSENTVAALMREQHLVARRKKKRKSATRPAKGRWRALDLVKRQFPAAKLNQKWYGGGTEISTDQGKRHLASVLDMGSGRVLGFSLSEHHDADLAYGALAMAVAVRGGQVPGVIFCTDQGSEYTAGAFRAACQRLGITQSMGRPGSALDNAVIEAWHSTLESGLGRAERFTTKAQARARVATWIEDYNTTCRHSALGMLSPLAYEQALAAGRRPEIPPLPRRPVSAGARPRQGRSSSGLAALRGLHLDSARAPAVTWQLRGARTSKISSNQSVRAKSLIGADGARSMVAEDIGLPMEGQMDIAGSMNITFKDDISPYVSHRPSVLCW